MSGPDGPHARGEQLDAIDLVEVARRILTDNGFFPDPPAALDRTVPPHDPRADAVDLTHAPWSSIDNEESRDLDQIELAERLDGGAIRVLVGIADVDALAPQGSPIDAHAAENTTSVYTGVHVFPMLPAALSEHRTSLLPDGERLAVITEFVVDAGGALLDRETRIYPARVWNRAKLVYERVGAWLEGHADSGLDPRIEAQVRLQDEVAQRMRRRRFEHGALELETVEARPVAEGGRIVDLAILHKNRARELVEDLMIAANGATARYLEQRRRSSIRRVVAKPKRWDRIVGLAAEHGVALPAEPSAKALAEFMAARRAAAPARFADLSLAVVKLMGPGQYVLQRADEPDQGHFGLAVDDYAHSTAPNRRYPDLITQRLLKAASAGGVAPYADEELMRIAEHCTERENAARKVERTMRKVGAAMLLSSRIGEEFDAIVTGASAKGVFVRLLRPPAEGRVVRGEDGMDVGDAVRVRLVDTAPEKGFIDFERA